MSQAARHVTIKDVAIRANCSTAVVSTVVNKAKGKTKVSEETRVRVLQAAQDLGYRLHFAARSLAHQRTRTLGIYIPPAPWSGPGFTYEGTILRGVETACCERNYDLLLVNQSGSQQPQVCVDKFLERRIDGMLLIHVQESGSPWLLDLLRRRFNIVAVDYPNPEPELDAVFFDNEAASRVAVEHLVSLGHRRIGFIGSCRNPAMADAAIRQTGFLRAMAQLKLPVRPEWVFDASQLPRPFRADEVFTILEGHAVAQHIIALGKKGPTAWLAYNDAVAVYLMRRLQAAGVQVPQQISLMGVDDAEICRISSPELTSIRHPLREMGQAAAEILIEKSELPDDLDGKTSTHKGRHIQFPPSLVARESTAPPPQV